MKDRKIYRGALVLSVSVHAVIALISLVNAANVISYNNINQDFKNRQYNRERIVAFRLDNIKKIKAGKKIDISELQGKKADNSGEKSAVEVENTLRYFEAIKQYIEKRKVYPVSAKRRGIEGEILLSFIVGYNGEVRSVKVTKSSGYEILDKAAADTIIKSAPFSGFAEFIKKHELEMNIIIAYKL
ncbi:MAG TPA: TonB family protein [Spirochaetota bacterium]|nr:TonB family protein [Spirochaetota bacterium]HPJ35771.1 TonB family protein [Spirochaetota bacterium]